MVTVDQRPVARFRRRRRIRSACTAWGKSRGWVCNASMVTTTAGRSRGPSSGWKRVRSLVLPSTSTWPRTVPVCWSSTASSGTWAPAVPLPRKVSPSTLYTRRPVSAAGWRARIHRPTVSSRRRCGRGQDSPERGLVRSPLHPVNGSRTSRNAWTTPRGSRRSGTAVDAVTGLDRRWTDNGSSRRSSCTANPSDQRC